MGELAGVSATVPPTAQYKTITTYYLGRKPSDIPANVMHLSVVRDIADVGYDRLPARTDVGVKNKVNEITVPGISDAERERRATAAGISGRVSLIVIVSFDGGWLTCTFPCVVPRCSPSQSCLHAIGSIDFPVSFPVDSMHLVLENVIKQLLELWSGTYKSSIRLGDAKAKSADAYVITKESWLEIDKMVSLSAKLIPSAMTRSIVSVSARWRWTAETHLFFLLALGPIVLKGHLPPPYFDHFLDLSEMMKMMVKLSLHKDTDIPYLRAGLKRWVCRFDE